MTIFLASKSKQRSALLQQLGFHPDIDFFTASVTVNKPNIQRSNRLSSSELRRYVLAVARLKAEESVTGEYVSSRNQDLGNSAIIGVHTIRVFGGQILSRPLATDRHSATPDHIRQAKQESQRTLQELSGREFSVLTGLVVLQGDNIGNHRSAWAETTVKLKSYSTADIDEYLRSREGLTIPGGIDLYGQGIVLCEGINGGFSNIGGLPLRALVDLFRDPLFANRIPFRLTDADKSRFSVPVNPGPPQVELVRFSEYDRSQAEAVPSDEIIRVLLVPGTLLADRSEWATMVRNLSEARRAGILIVLENSAAVEEALGQENYHQLLHNWVDLLLDGQNSPDKLAKAMSPRLLLASQSPRRRELLKQIVAPNQIEVRISNEDEEYRDEPPADRVQRLALAKARAVYQQRASYSPSIDIVIGADTEVVLEGKALGKPVNADEARDQLSRLSGRTHQVLTGIALIRTADGREFVDHVSTGVTFKSLTWDEIEIYISSGEPFDKAGSYAIQSKGELLVSAIHGSYSNVVGLPLERLSEVLDREFNLPVWRFDAFSGKQELHES